MDATDVVVVGAGPAGMLVAGDLAEAGVDVVVLERRSGEESNLTRAMLVSARTLEQFDVRGIADELVATGLPLPIMRLYSKFNIDMSALPTRFAYSLITPQYNTEAVLRRRAERLGVRFEWECDVSGVRQDESGVEVEAAGRRWRAQYAIGADGSRSAVRQAINEPFPGDTLAQSMMLADVRFGSPPEDVLRSETGPLGAAFYVPFGDGWHRVIAWNRNDTSPVETPLELESVQIMLRDVYGTDFDIQDCRFRSRFEVAERQVAHYRIGRIFLAGDAAHVHSPAAGQGMNTGLQDAANLGWRLTAAVRGDAAPDVLDGYHRERHPVGQMVIQGSGEMQRQFMTQSAETRGSWSSGPMAQRSDAEMAATVSGIGIRYAAPPGADPAVGTRVADLALADGSRLYEALRCRQFVLVKGSGRGDAATSLGWRGPVTEVVAASPPATDLLVRPDAYLAAVG